MNFNYLFMNSLLSSPLITKSISIEDYLPIPLPLHDSLEHTSPSIQAYGHIHTSFPYHYSLANLDSYCLLYTEQGSGSITYLDQEYSLPSNSLLLIHCTHLHHVDIKHSPWVYKAFYFTGQFFSHLYQSITQNNSYIQLIDMDTPTYHNINSLFHHLDKQKECSLFHVKLLSNILFDLAIDIHKSKSVETPIASYLKKIKIMLDNEYHNNITLDSLEQQFHISRFRICREFTKSFGISPMQYLSLIRVEAAKEALLHTDKRINEISHMIGIENTNHFIRLFKQKTGVTPLIYRKQSPAFM